jgi:hypothetical protein
MRYATGLQEYRMIFAENMKKLIHVFYILLTCISSQFIVNNQPGALFHVFIYLFIYSFHLSTCFEQQVLMFRRSNCINTSSGMINLCK